MIIIKNMVQNVKGKIAKPKVVILNNINILTSTEDNTLGETYLRTYSTENYHREFQGIKT